MWYNVFLIEREYIMKVIILSVNNEGGDNGSYNGDVIGVFEELCEVEEVSEEWMMEKSKELYNCECEDEDEEIGEGECEVGVCGDKSYVGSVEVNGDIEYCFKIIE